MAAGEMQVRVGSNMRPGAHSMQTAAGRATVDLARESAGLDCCEVLGRWGSGPVIDVMGSPRSSLVHGSSMPPGLAVESSPQVKYGNPQNNHSQSGKCIIRLVNQ